MRSESSGEYYGGDIFHRAASISDTSVTEKIHDLRYQLYILMGVCLTAFVILLFAIVMIYTLLERYKNEMRNHFNQSRNTQNINGAASTLPFSSREILPDEDMSRRGYMKYSGFSPELVARVESHVSTVSRHHSGRH